MPQWAWTGFDNFSVKAVTSGLNRVDLYNGRRAYCCLPQRLKHSGVATHEASSLYLPTYPSQLSLLAQLVMSTVTVTLPVDVAPMFVFLSFILCATLITHPMYRAAPVVCADRTI